MFYSETRNLLPIISDPGRLPAKPIERSPATAVDPAGDRLGDRPGDRLGDRPGDRLGDMLGDRPGDRPGDPR